MAQLHQVLAVDKELSDAARKIIQETVRTFAKKVDLFSGHNKTLEMLDESRAQEAEGMADFKEVTTTVPDRLEYTSTFVIRYLDAMAQKEITNTGASATVYIDNMPFLEDIPATLLLGLERELARLRTMYDAIPTLANGVRWVEDIDMGRGIHRAVKSKVTQRTEKRPHVLSVAAATPQHKEQTQVYNVDEVVGQWTQENYSGLIASGRKAEILGRLDELLLAVKKARAEANTAEVCHLSVGKRIMSYLHKGL